MSSDPSIIIVTSNECSSCADLKREHPEFRKVATEVELDTKVCIGPETCGTGADFLIETSKATGKSLSYTPECLVLGPNGERGVCGDEVFDQVLDGKKPDLSGVKLAPPRGANGRKAPAPFKFWDSTV